VSDELKSCPFCGIKPFTYDGEPEDFSLLPISIEHISDKACPLSELVTSYDKWNTRPETKEGGE